jgi:hypothetical protein
MKTIEWRTTFGLESATYATRLILSERQAYAAPYGSAMAQGFSENIAGYLTYQNKPVAVFMSTDDPDATLAKETWDRLWNQGLASVLIFHCPDKIKVYSLFGLPDDGSQGALEPIEVLKEIELGIDAYRMQCSDLIRRLEDGRYYTDHRAWFESEHRVDKRLFGNLVATCGRLKKHGLQNTEAQTLLLQVIFIAYLEDRKILNSSDFLKMTGGNCDTLADLLQSGNVRDFYALFVDLSKKFNSDVFLSPCSFEKIIGSPLTSQHLAVLREFRCGEIDCTTRQYAFWPLYDFKFIPVELLSAIYDHFQGSEREGVARRDTGSYYTPAFVAQTCLGLAWGFVPTESALSYSFTVLDPSCGSAVFLVCAFQRLVGLARANEHEITWEYLCRILTRMHGVDISENALRVGIVSLYIALLEHIDPPALTPLFRQGKILPPLLNVSMKVADFFADAANAPVASYNLIIGNPPWVSRKSDLAKSMLKWCAANGYKNDTPGDALIWGFIWKSLSMIKKEGAVALLVEAKQLLFNMQAEKSRRRLFTEYKVPLIVNASDARHQWFEGADAPGALCVIQNHGSEAFVSEETDYWSIKANPEYSIAQRVVLASEDRVQLKQWRLARNSSLLSQWQWGRSRDVALLNNLLRYKPLKERLMLFKEWRRTEPQNMWCIGQGFTPSTHHERTPITTSISGLSTTPFVSAKMKNFRWQLPSIINQAGIAEGVQRARIIEPLIVSKTLKPPLILIKQGVSKKTGLVQAAYTDRLVAFQDSLQAIISPQGKNDSYIFKVLTAVLNSHLAAWFYLHASAARGVERDKIHEGEIPLLPFPMPNESDDPNAADEIVLLMDRYAKERKDCVDQQKFLQSEERDFSFFEDSFNELVYRYYGINDHERCVIEDTIKYIVPSMQPSKSSIPILWSQTDQALLEKYAKRMQEAFSANYQSGVDISVTVYRGSQSLLLAEVVRGEGSYCRVITSEQSLSSMLSRLNAKLADEFAAGVHHLADMTFAVKNKIYLIKPNRIRHWMESTALCDVDRIVSDLYAAKARLL